MGGYFLFSSTTFTMERVDRVVLSLIDLRVQCIDLHTAGHLYRRCAIKAVYFSLK